MVLCVCVSLKTSAIWRKPPKQNKRGGRVVGSEAAKERIAQRSAEEEAELERSRSDNIQYNSETTL